MLVLSNYEVVAKGRLLPYTSGEIYRIVLFDRVSIYVEPETKPSLDVFNSYILVSISSISLLALILVPARTASAPRVRTFFLLSWLGTGLLAADELLGVHESLGHNLQSLRDIPGVDRPDDVIVGLYGVAALAYVAAFRRIILASVRARILFALAVLVVVLAAAADVADVCQVEELLEALASVFVLVGFTILTVEELRSPDDAVAPVPPRHR